MNTPVLTLSNKYKIIYYPKFVADSGIVSYNVWVLYVNSNPEIIDSDLSIITNAIAYEYEEQANE